MNYYKGLEIIGKTGDFDKIPTELLHDYINDFTLEFNSRSLVKKLNRMENEKELTLMPYGDHNGIVICCKNCGSEFEETSEGYYPPIKYESDKHNRLCRRCLTELGTFS